MLSLLVFGLLSAVRNRSLSTLFSTLWDFGSVILSDIIARRIVGNFSRVMTGLRLLCSLVLLTVFAAGLWNFMIHKDTINKIDSWDDLHTKPQWKKIKIYSPYFFEMSEFILRDSSPMASDLRERSIMYDPFKFIFDKKAVENMMQDVMNGEAVHSLDSLVLHYYKIRFKDMLRHLGSGFDYHTSRSGFGVKHYFIQFSPRFGSNIINKFNTLMARLIDMGIYEYEGRKSLRLNGYGPDITTEVDTEAYEFGPITLKQMKGVSLILIFASLYLILMWINESDVTQWHIII